jgi:hypothetical protein
LGCRRLALTDDQGMSGVSSMGRLMLGANNA